MSLRRARPLDDLYAAVSDYDLVVVPDAPLAGALNRRLDQPHLGTFATTPRRLAAGRRERAEDRLAFLEVVSRTDLGWKEAAYAIGNALQCWEHRGRVDALLDYETYADRAARAVVDTLADLDTTSRRLADYEIDAAQSVAVVGLDQLTALERSILPPSVDTFDPFADSAFDLPPFHVYDSSASIVDALLDAITAENADDVAVVLDRGSEYSPLVEAALEAADIPFYGGPGFADDPDHRAFVQVLRAAHRGPGVTVGDLRPVLTRLGIDVDVEHDEKRLHALDAPDVEWLCDFCTSIDGTTYGEALVAFEKRAGCTLDVFHDELSRLGIVDESVIGAGVDRLEFYLTTYDVPVDRGNEGVLLADATTAASVDRPVVFYLGLDEAWTRNSPRRPWIDRDAEFDRHIQQFQLLLQNGAEQYYLVQDAKGGSPVTPCLYFEELLDEEFERFSDLASVSHTHTFGATDSGFDRDSLDVEPRSPDTISQSSLNTYANCPRDYFFGRIVDSPDRDYFKEGNLFHDFAEYYVTHPDAVDDDVVDEVVEVMLEEVQPFVRDVDGDLRRTKYRIGLETIVEYLDANPSTPVGASTVDGGRDSNYFADYFDRPVDAPHTERWFENEGLGVEGKIDLVHSRTRLLDYKSGRKKSATRVVKNAALDQPSDTPNYQALLYLAHWRSVHPGERHEFTFFHFLEVLDDVVRGEVDLDDAVTTVTYNPRPFDDYVSTRDAYDELLDGYNDCVATFDDLGYERYHSIVEELSFPQTTDKAELRASDFAAAFTAAVADATADDVDAEKGCDQAIRALNGVRRRNFFADDVDAFEAFVDERLDELDRRRAGAERFPVDGLGGEPNYRRVDNRDLLLHDDD